jgi:hypothetical protein
MLIAHGATDPDAVEWRAFIDACTATNRELAALLVDTAGGGINAAQRGQIQEVMARAKLRASVLTDSAMVRGAVTALAWFGIPIRAFPRSDRAAAIDALGIDATARGSVLAALDRIRVGLR